MQDKTEEKFFLQRLRTSSTGSYLFLDYPATEHLRRNIYGTTFIFYLWLRPWGVA